MPRRERAGIVAYVPQNIQFGDLSVLSSLHDFNQALGLADRFFLMKDGAVRYSGGVEVFTEAVIRDVFSRLPSCGVGGPNDQTAEALLAFIEEEEKFVALGQDMDILVMDAAAVKNIKPLYAEDPVMFDSCKAWREGEVYLQMAYNAYYTNYEIALINTWFLGKAVYPELFADIDMAEKTDEVTEAFLGQKLAEQMYAYPNSFGGYQRINAETFFG